MEITFCNIKFRGLKREDILKASLSEFVQVVTLSSESIVIANKTPKLMEIANTNYSTFDGFLPYKLAKFTNKDVDFEKISGADFIYDILNFAKEVQWKVFLLGGKEYSNNESVKRIKAEYALSTKGVVTGFLPYPFPTDKNESIRKEIEAFSPDIILVALGLPKQEYWIAENQDFLIRNNVKLAMGCGGTLEVFSGMIKRAPIFIQKIGMEGLYRFIVEPKFIRLKRLMKSFLIFNYLGKNISE